MQPRSPENGELLAVGCFVCQPLSAHHSTWPKHQEAQAGMAIGAAHGVQSNTLKAGQPHSHPVLEV